MRRTHRPLILYVFWAVLIHAVAFAALVPMATRHASSGGPFIVFLARGYSSPAKGSFVRPTNARPPTETKEVIARVQQEKGSPSDVAQDQREIAGPSDLGGEISGGSIAGTGVFSSGADDDRPVGHSSDGEASYASRLSAVIEAHKWYPPLARLKNIEGTPVLAFRIQSDGRPADMRIERSSRSSILDAAAMATIERISKFPPPPAEIGDRRVWIVPIQYTLQENARN